MVGEIIVLSGNVGAGKSTVATLLKERFGVHHIRTQDLLLLHAGDILRERRALQEFGEKLDRKTKGAWVREGLDRVVRDFSERKMVVVDSIRIPKQIEAIRAGYGRGVLHVHLTAAVEALATRYGERAEKLGRTGLKELASYAEVQKNKTESQIAVLEKVADVVIRTDRCTPEDVLVRVASCVGLYGRESDRLVDVLIGGCYGSEGKGQVAAYLAPEYNLLVRVGGPNAGHSVFEEPIPYVFHQLPSGTRASQAQLLIGPGAVLRVPGILKEISECKVAYDRLSIDPQAMIISDADVTAEQVLRDNIGSTGQGVGSATSRRLLHRGKSSVKLARDVRDLKPFVRDAVAVLENSYARGERILLEGTQGTGLSLYHGHYPHVSSRDTTVSGCLAEAGIPPGRVRKVVMVCRTYPIRVQSPSEEKHSGWMSREIGWDVVAQRSGHRLSDLEKAEITSTTKRKRRVSEFDWVLFRKATTLNAPTDIALTFVDYIEKKNQAARRFDQLTEDTIRFVEEIERVATAPVSLIATRFHSRSIIDRRAW